MNSIRWIERDGKMVLQERLTIFTEPTWQDVYIYKEPNKDFRTRLRKIIHDAEADDTLVDYATDRILALCKEMLVQGEKETHLPVSKRSEVVTGWNSYNYRLLKQLGENIK